MLIDHYLNGLKFAEIGRQYNITRERVRQLVKRAIDKLKTRAIEKQLSMADFHERW